MRVARRYGFRRWLLLLAVFGAGATLIDGFLVEPFRLVRRSLTLPIPGLTGGPVRILLFADMNFESVGRREKALRGVALDFQPDLIFVAGDLVDSPRSVRDGAALEATAEFLNSLPAPSGRFMALGERETSYADRLKAAWADGRPSVIASAGRNAISV